MDDELSIPIMMDGFTIERLMVRTIGEMSRKAVKVIDMKRMAANSHFIPAVYSLFPFLKYKRVVINNPNIIQNKMNHQG